MNAVPTWWLVLSGLFFVLALVSAALLSYLLVRLISIVKTLEPKVETLGQRVDSIGEKVESIATKVDAMATSAKTSVEVVGAKAQGVATGAEALGLLAGKKAAVVSEYMVVGTLAYRLITKLMASRSAKSKKA